MKIAKKIGVLILFNLVGLFCGIVVSDKTSNHRLQKTNHPTLNSRQTPEKCDLICPGRPPLAVPPNFMQNCTTPVTSSSTQSTPSSTTRRPSSSTTTESGEENGENGSGEDSEESTEASTKKTTGKTRKKAVFENKQIKSKNNHGKFSKKSQNQLGQGRKQFRKERVALKQNVKKKHFGGRSRLDGCYVVCTEGNGPGNGENPGEFGSGGPVIDESGSEEFDEDNYVPGEDTPIEIIYIPGSTKRDQRPIELYETNNYAFLEPQFPIGYGYDPFLMEGKQKNTNNRKHKIRKKSKTATQKTNLDNKNMSKL